MNKKFMVAIALSGLLTTMLSADALKNSLNQMIHKKDTAPAMVDLSRLNVGAQQPKTRSSKAVVAVINGKNIIKKDADSYLAKRTNGEVKDFDILPKKQRLRLLEEMAVPTLAEYAAEKELSSQEKDAILTRIWMQKQAVKNPVTEEQVKAVYSNLEKEAKENNSTRKLPAYNDIKKNLKMQMSEKAIIGNLMKDVKIELIDANMIAGRIGDIYISLEDANSAINSISKGKATWNSLPASDKERVLKMIAPSKLVQKAAQKEVSAKEKKTAYTNFWMQNKIMKTEVSDKELKAEYDTLVKASKQAKSKQKLPSFDTMKNTLHMQVARKKVLADLMKSAKIKLK